MPGREVREGGPILLRLQQQRFDLGELGAEHAGDGVQLSAHEVGAGLGEDRADRRGDHFPRVPVDHTEGVSQEMNPAPLPGGAEHDLADRGDQPGVLVGDDQTDPGQATLSQRAQKFLPERLALAVPDHQAQDLAVAVLGDAGGDHNGPRDDLMVHPRLAVSRVQVDVGEADVIQRAGAKCGQRLVQHRADPRDFGLGDPAVPAQGFDQVIDAAGGDAVHVCLHDDRVEGMVDAAPSLQQAGEGAAGADLGNLQVQVAGQRGQHLLAVPVADGGPCRRVLVPLRTDVGTCLGLDQLLHHSLGDGADELDSVGRA